MADYAQYGGNAPFSDSFQTATAVPAGPKLATMANWTGALVSLALIAGIGVWSYKLVMRDVTGVPVVQATSGPMREAPVDPGGRLAAHQGFAVNQVAAEETSAPLSDRLVLAPAPADLDEEDQPVGPLLAAPQFAQSPEAQVELAVFRDEDAMTTEVEFEPVIPNSVQALADQIAANLTPLTPLAPGNDVPVQTTLVAAATGPGPAISLRPKSRPTGVQTASLVVAAPAAAGEELSSGAIASGDRLVQLGAFDSPEVARAEWTRLSARFGPFLAGKSRVVQQATSGGRTFYRLRAHGFADLSEARQFCAAFMAEGADCIPVVAK